MIGGRIKAGSEQLLKLLVRAGVDCLYAAFPARNSGLGDVEQLRSVGLFDSMQQAPPPERDARQGWLWEDARHF
ncbi:conserved hypothetical protein [Pseudomonas sp. PM2]